MNKQEIQETINELHRMKKRLTGAQGCSVHHEEANAYSARCLSVAISVLIQHLNSGWIPVTERLPKEDGNYLVTMKHKEFNQTKVTSMDFNGEFLFNDYFEKAWWEVTAWQPLPEPYKEDKDAKRN